MMNTDTLPMPRRPDYLTPEQYGKLTGAALEAALGRKVDTYVGPVGTIVRCTDGLIRVRIRLVCAKCRKRSTKVYLSMGAPGLCYAHSRGGKYLADLRNQEYRCPSCPDLR